MLTLGRQETRRLAALYRLISKYNYLAFNAAKCRVIRHLCAQLVRKKAIKNPSDCIYWTISRPRLCSYSYVNKSRLRLNAIFFLTLLCHSSYADSHKNTKSLNGPLKQSIIEKETPPPSTFFLTRLFDNIQAPALEEKKQTIPSGPQFPGSTKTVDRTSNITIQRFVDARYLDKVFKGKLKGQGTNIIKTAKRYGLDPVFFAAIMAQETGWGTSSKIKNQNNPGGIFRNGKYSSFRSIEDGIDAMAANLSNRYVNRKILTINGVAAVYAPIGAKNDPKRRNKLWPGGVTAIMNKIINGSTNMGNTKMVAKQ